MTVISILAEELQVGDVWMGGEGLERTELAIDGVSTQDGWMFIPWGRGKTYPPVEMKAVQIVGTLRRWWGFDLTSTFSGTWTLQEDQPIEVRRGSAVDIEE